MTITTHIHCDECRGDITTTDATPAFRLNLSSQAMPSDSPIRHCVHIPDPLPNDMQFCGMRCLKAWINRVRT